MPADADLCREIPVRALATSRRTAGTSSAVVPARWFFDPADFPAVTWHDDFDTDHLAEYRVNQPIGTELASAFTITGGTLTATATKRSFGLLAAPATSSARPSKDPDRALIRERQ